MQLVWVKTLHGKFVFCLQKYQFHSQSTSYLELTSQLQEGYVSPRLQELCGYYSNRLSYEELAKLVERVSGEGLLSNQKIGQIVSSKALQLSQEIHNSVTATLVKTKSPLVIVNPKVDIYNPETKEILLFDDGIQVKAQKAEWQPKLEQRKKNQNPFKGTTPTIFTDIVLLQKAIAKFEYIAAPINANGKAY